MESHPHGSNKYMLNIFRTFAILEVKENYVRAYNYITSKEEHINLENIKGVYVNITRM